MSGCYRESRRTDGAFGPTSARGDHTPRDAEALLGVEDEGAWFV